MGEHVAPVLVLAGPPHDTVALRVVPVHRPDSARWDVRVRKLPLYESPWLEWALDPQEEDARWTGERRRALSLCSSTSSAAQHFLYFLPELQGQGALGFGGFFACRSSRVDLRGREWRLFSMPNLSFSSSEPSRSASEQGAPSIFSARSRRSCSMADTEDCCFSRLVRRLRPWCSAPQLAHSALLLLRCIRARLPVKLRSLELRAPLSSSSRLPRCLAPRASEWHGGWRGDVLMSSPLMSGTDADPAHPDTSMNI